MAQLDYLIPKIINVPLEGSTITGLEWQGMNEVPMPEEFVVMGDHNLAPNMPEYTRNVGEPDYYYGSVKTYQHLVDTWVQAGNKKE